MNFNCPLSIRWDHTFRSLSVCLKINIHFTLFDFDNFPFELIQCRILKSHCNRKPKKKNSKEWEKANAITSNCIFIFLYINWNRKLMEIAWNFWFYVQIIRYILDCELWIVEWRTNCGSQLYRIVSLWSLVK